MFSHPVVLRKEQLLPISLKEAWTFFSSPKNLATITPDYMKFEVCTPEDELQSIYPGQMITYTVRPLLNIPLKWTTEITAVEHEKYFIDEQRYGPYRFWHHRHLFKEVPEGVLMQDIVSYLLPLGPLGWIARHLFVKKQLNDIFEYRTQKLEELFKGESVMETN